MAFCRGMLHNIDKIGKKQNKTLKQIHGRKKHHRINLYFILKLFPQNCK